MSQSSKKILFLLFLILSTTTYAKTLVFSNLVWQVRNDFGQPGPNYFSENNVWVDSNGALHLRIKKNSGVWQCPEIYTEKKLGFGEYWIYSNARLDLFDQNVIFDIYNLPTIEVGDYGTNEIEIQHGKMHILDNTFNTILSVWPAVVTPGKTSFVTNILPQTTNLYTSGFTWRSNQIRFRISSGYHVDFPNPLVNWLFIPTDYLLRIPQQPMQFHINLWLLYGNPPTNNKVVEVIIDKFCYKSLDGTVNNCA